MKFEKIESTDNIKNIIKSISGMDLDVAGLWGYDRDSATILMNINNYTLNEFENLLCTLRANIQMSMTLSEEKRYVSISVTEIKREKIIEKMEDKIYDKVTYHISATKELDFKNLIQEYKKNYGDDSFDLTEHFKKREDCKINIEEVYLFDITNL